MKLTRLCAFLLWFLLLTVILSACLVEIEYSPTKTIIPTSTDTLQPSTTLAPSLTPTQTATLAPTITSTPTPAPVTWKVEKGDELMAIAFYYGITLDELLAANPSVTPNWMSVGTVLEIPVTPTPVPTNTPTPTSTSTAQALQEQTATPSGPLILRGKPTCYLDALGVLNCLALINNQGDETLENPSVTFTLTSEEGNPESELVVFAALNLLPVGSSLPVLASFPAPVPEEYNLEVNIVSRLPTMPDDDRYAEVAISSSEIRLSDDGLLARVSGEINAKTEGRDLAALWLLMIAFDEDGNPVGFRRWEAALPITKTENLSFNSIVYSLGPAIHEVELFAEARFQNP